MSGLTFTPMRLEGLQKVTPFYATDLRGYFLKIYEKGAFRGAGMDGEIWESFVTFSKRNVLRGLHIQRPKPQAKLVTVLYGEIFDVGVDLRQGSPTYGQWEGLVLSHENRQGLYLPEGFAHGFLVRSDFALVSYLCSGAYDPKGDGGIRWDDVDVGVDWGLTVGMRPIVSQRDGNLPTLADYERQGRIWKE